MDRTCTRCHRPFGAGDLVRSVSKGMEADRKAAGLEGICLLDYRCPECRTDSIFVDILPRDGEEVEQYLERMREMEQLVRGLHAERVDAVTVAVREPAGRPPCPCHSDSQRDGR